MARLSRLAALILAFAPGSAAWAHTAVQPHTHEALTSPAGALVAGLAALVYAIGLALRLLAARRSARFPHRRRREL